MLHIKTIRNHLITGKEKDTFCFRSVASQTLNENSLIQEMLSYNSSFTEADIAGLFSVLGTVVNKYLAKGYNVILPFGALRANATGTCDTINTSFSQGTGNHQIGFIFNPSEKTLSEVNANLEYKQILPAAQTKEKSTESADLMMTLKKSDWKNSTPKARFASAEEILPLILRTKFRAFFWKMRMELQEFQDLTEKAQIS